MPDFAPRFLLARSCRPFWLALLPVLLITTSGCGWFGSQQAVVDAALKELEARRAEMISANPEIETVNFSADDSGAGVVIEYVYKVTTKVKPEFTSESARKKLIAQFKGTGGIKSILDQGVFVRFIFKKSDGTVIADSKIERADL